MLRRLPRFGLGLLFALIVGATGCGGQSSSSRGTSAGSGPSHAGSAGAGGSATSTAGAPSTSGGNGGASSGGNDEAGTAGMGSTNLYDSCNEAAECELMGAGCCGPCDNPGLTPADFRTYNRKYRERFPSCDVACGACPNPDGELTYKYFFANCVKGHCVVEDLRTSSINTCEQDSDCQLRHGKSCCPSCAGEDVVPVRSDGSFEELACGGVPQPCPQCVAPPIEQLAVCNNGHCAIGAP